MFGKSIVQRYRWNARSCSREQFHSDCSELLETVFRAINVDDWRNADGERLSASNPNPEAVARCTSQIERGRGGLLCHTLNLHGPLNGTTATVSVRAGSESARISNNVSIATDPSEVLSEQTYALLADGIERIFAPDVGLVRPTGVDLCDPSRERSVEIGIVTFVRDVSQSQLDRLPAAARVTRSDSGGVRIWIGDLAEHSWDRDVACRIADLLNDDGASAQ